MIRNKFYVIDAHCHVYPDKIAEKAVKGTVDFYEATSSCDGTVSGLIEFCDKAGTDRFIIQSVATTPKQVKSINEFIAAEVKKNPERLTGLGTLHPNSFSVREDVDHLISLGLKGVKLHPDIQDFRIDDPKCFPIYEECDKHGLPILMHTGDYRYERSNPEQLIPVLKMFPSLKIIGAHLGGWSIWNKASIELHGLPNLYVDCSSCTAYMTPKEVEKIIRLYGVDRVLYGTDYPMWNPKEELDRFMKIKLSDNERKMIFSDNAKRLFGIV